MLWGLHGLHISIHTFLAEGDSWEMANLSDEEAFQSTPSLRKATPEYIITDSGVIFQSTPSLRKATHDSRGLLAFVLFQSTPSLRKATAGISIPFQCHAFQSTPSLRKATPVQVDDPNGDGISIHTFLAEGDGYRTKRGNLFDISIHTFLAEGDPLSNPSFCFFRHFNPHLPCGRRLISLTINPVMLAISIHTFLAEGDSFLCQHHRCIHISIHTFLAEGDPFAPYTSAHGSISIHTFLAEGDVTHRYPFILAITFQSTPSLRKATCTTGIPPSTQAFQSTPSLRKATRSSAESWYRLKISIHTFLAEGDSRVVPCYLGFVISIHTFLAEGDYRELQPQQSKEYFNPHLPCGRRHRAKTRIFSMKDFNPHLPCGRRRQATEGLLEEVRFQSTPSLRKATTADPFKIARQLFQSTPSLRKATAQPLFKLLFPIISIHTFLAEGDSSAIINVISNMYFNPHLPCGRRPDTLTIRRSLTDFNPHLPCGRRPLPFSHPAGRNLYFNPHLPCGRRP